MISPISIMRQDHCPECDSEKSLECYDTYGRPIYLTKILDSGDIKFPIGRSLSYMKCKKCGKKFALDWTDDRKIPRPLTWRNKIISFMEGF